MCANTFTDVSIFLKTKLCTYITPYRIVNLLRRSILTFVLAWQRRPQTWFVDNTYTRNKFNTFAMQRKNCSRDTNLTFRAPRIGNKPVSERVIIETRGVLVQQVFYMYHNNKKNRGRKMARRGVKAKKKEKKGRHDTRHPHFPYCTNLCALFR